MKNKTFLCVAASSCLALGGCATMQEQMSNAGKIFGGAAGAVVGSELTKNIDNKYARAALILASTYAGAYIGDQFAKALSKEDQEKLFVAQQQAVATGKEVSFSGEPGVTGRVTVVSDKPAVREQKVVAVKVLKDKVEQTPPLNLVGAPYSPKNQINVRSGPGTDYKVVGSLGSDQSVQVIGEALPGKSWYLISQLPDGTAGGYVYGPLMEPSSQPVNYVQASHESVESVDLQATSECKTILQEVTTSEGTISEEITVCQQGDGTWKLAE